MAIELTIATAEQISGIQNALKLDIPVLTDYPTTDATKVGQKFIYKGNEWKYHSQEELDSLGWGSLESEGFPAPVNKVQNKDIYFLDSKFYYPVDSTPYVTDFSGTIDFLGLGNPQSVKVLRGQTDYAGWLPYMLTITEFKNASLLANLEDMGTASAFFFVSNTIAGSVLDDLFTQLPPTAKTATIYLPNVTGKNECDPTIATAKGYTVVT